MTIETLLPGLSCICTEPEVEAALAQGFKELYIVTVGGIFKHHQLRGNNRFLRIKVDQIPGRAKPNELKEDISTFLPAGKVPHELYKQVEAFFRKVTARGNAQLEAMIFVLWTQERGYHLFVPTQSVSAAAVRFDPSELPEGSTIVVDIHSHNSMGAFFSGTDNNNDKDTVRYSGVFGKLNTEKAETIWRFNYFEKKFPVNAFDIFEPPVKEEVAVPEEWLGKVQTSYQTTYAKGGYSGQGNVGRPYPEHLRQYQYQKQSPGNPANTASTTNTQSGVNAKTGVSPMGASRDWTEIGEDDLGVEAHFFGHTRSGLPFDEDLAWQDYYENHGSAARAASSSTYQERLAANNKPSTALTTVPPADTTRAKWGYDPKTPLVTPPSTVPALTTVRKNGAEVIVLDASDEPTSGEEALARVTEDANVDTEVGAYQMGKPEALPFPQSQSADGSGNVSNYSGLQHFTEGKYEALVEEFGKDVADTWWSIDQTMHVLCNHDEVMVSLMYDMFELLGDDGKNDFCEEIIARLPDELKERIQTHGL